jgi:hypothetical protein
MGPRLRLPPAENRDAIRAPFNALMINPFFLEKITNGVARCFTPGPGDVL